MSPIRSRALAGAAAAALLAAGLAGCGGGDDATTVTQTVPATAATAATTPPAATSDTVATALTGATAPDTAGGGTDTAAGTVDTTALGDIARYLEDVQAASNSLTTFGTALQAVDNPRQLEARYAALTAELDTFDEAIARMEGYTLPEAQIEAQRARLVAAGPPLSDVLRRFLDAAQEAIDTNSPAPLRAILPEVAAQIRNFTQAAQGGTSTTP